MDCCFCSLSSGLVFVPMRDIRVLQHCSGTAAVAATVGSLSRAVTLLVLLNACGYHTVHKYMHTW